MYHASDNGHSQGRRVRRSERRLLFGCSRRHCRCDYQLQPCIQAKQISVATAFFLSTEFQQTGYWVERMYKTAYGDGSGTSTLGGTHQIPVPRLGLDSFQRDAQAINQGVVVGRPGWETVL